MSKKNSVYGAEKRIPTPRGTIRQGSFALVQSGWEDGNLTLGDWVYCRDSWHSSYSGNMQHMAVYHNATQGPNIAAFVRKFEVAMKHTRFTEIGATSLNRVSWVKPADFWLRSNMRKSLFTILLRAGMSYRRSKDNFDAVLKSNAYLRSTGNALKWFMSGHTWFNDRTSSGWLNHFHNMTQERVKSALTLRPVTDQMLLTHAMRKLGLTKAALTADFRKNRKEVQKPLEV